jgi:hypothetical protein
LLSLVLEGKGEAMIAADDGQFIAFRPAFENCLLVGAPEDQHRSVSDDQGDGQQALIIFGRPVDRDPGFASARQSFKRLSAKPFGKILGIQALVMNEAGQAFDRRFLIALRAGEFGLIAGLFFKDRRDKGRDGFDLMAVRQRQQLFDIVLKACRRFACSHDNRKHSATVHDFLEQSCTVAECLQCN